jgi:hypothetical protein
MADIDPFPVAALPDRFSTSKQTVYSRMKALGISPFKKGKRAFVQSDQLHQLDALHHHLSQGGHLHDFTSNLTAKTRQLDSLDSSTQTSDKTDEPLERLVNFTESLTGALMDLTDPISNLRRLQEAVKNGWLLTTSQVQALTGAKPHGASWLRGSFQFHKAGQIGREAAWSVHRSDI